MMSHFMFISSVFTKASATKGSSKENSHPNKVKLEQNSNNIKVRGKKIKQNFTQK